jgi:tRNA-binding EMAP/Myf-like protein
MPVIAMQVTEKNGVEGAENLFHYTFSSPEQGDLQIIANTTNVYEIGDVAGIALVGTKLPGLEIKPRKVFGIPSSGMACGPVDATVDTNVSGQFNADAPARTFQVTLTVNVEASYAEDAGKIAMKKARSEGNVTSVTALDSLHPGDLDVQAPA